jgi:hypothetical protein
MDGQRTAAKNQPGQGFFQLLGNGHVNGNQGSNDGKPRQQ